MLSGINFFLAIIGLGFALYVSRDKWRGKIGV
jgi:hypothetical protein